MDTLIADNYTTSVAIKSQLNEIFEQQRMMQLSIIANHGQTYLMHFLMEQFSMFKILPTHSIALVADLIDENHSERPGDGDGTDLSDRGTAVPDFTPADILKMLDIDHVRLMSDSRVVMRKGMAMEPADIEFAACIMTEPQVKQLLNSTSGSSVVSADGHFDRTQMGKVSPLSYICHLLSQMMREVSQAPPLLSLAPTSPASPTTPHKRPVTSNIVLEYFCALHTADEDNLRGPQGLLRCLCRQLVLSMVANQWVSESNALLLPQLRDGEEELLARQDHGATCRLFNSLIRLVPEDASIYCIVDGWSAYEREELWQADCNTALEAFRDAIGIRSSQGGAAFKLLITSPTVSRSLDDLVQPHQRVSLRGRDGREGKWRGTGRGRLISVARVGTMLDMNAER